MARLKNLKEILLFTVYLFCPRFCSAQGNRASTENPCGRCGPFGVCDPQGSPTSSCLQGFYPRNSQEWGSGNWTGGCARTLPLSCERSTSGGGEDKFFKLPIMMSAGSSERLYGPEDQCKAGCLRNCSCLAFGFDRYGCGFWTGPLIGIQKSPTGSASYLYIRVAYSELELDHKNNPKKMVVILVVVGFVIISICTYFSWKWIAKHRVKKNALELANASSSGPVDASSLQDVRSQKVNLEDVPQFEFEILAWATSNFSEANMLGKGGFGPVYKGALANGREIAVKRLSKASAQGMEEFMNEVGLISKLQHRNLVRLLGCCVQNMETMLIYEYLPNKSLDFFLFDPSQEILDWRKRFNIIEGICLGLLYLHRDSRLKIIHRDLKPCNILLDSDWNPKISDFGMARIYGTKQDHVITVRAAGTYGYMPPEYAISGRFSEKTDVFSFGVVILEIATGRKNTSFQHDGCLNLLGHVWNMWNEGNVAALIDPRISSPSHQAEVVRCIHTGLLCVQELPTDRPYIPAVLSMLSSEIIKLPEPKQPAFAIKSSSTSRAGTSSSQQSQRSSSSINNVTLTTVAGR